MNPNQTILQWFSGNNAEVFLTMENLQLLCHFFLNPAKNIHFYC